MSYLQVSKSCLSHKIRTSVLEESVLEAIQVQVKLVIELEKSEFMKLFEEIESKIKKLNENIEIYTSTYRENIKKIIQMIIG